MEPVIDAISIYTEATPNPAALKFVANKMFLTDAQVEIDREDTKGAPLVEAIFNEFKDVESAFVSKNFITLSKNDSFEWFEIMNDVRLFIKEWLSQKKEIFSEEFVSKVKSAKPDLKGIDENSSIEEKIHFILDKYVRPGVAQDGGAIDFASYDPETKKVGLVMKGSCSGCPSSQITLKQGIQSLFERYLPEDVSEVEAVEG